MRAFIAAVIVCAALAAQAVEPEFVVKLATVAPEGSPWATGLVEFKKRAETAAGGRLKVKLFLGGTLGDENDTVMAVKRGQIQAFGGSTAALASQVPEFNVIELPYLFERVEEADFVLDKIVKTDIAKACSDRGLTFGFWSENGYRSFGGKFKVSSPEDLKGRKMRSQDNPIHLLMYRTFGGSPVPIPTTDVLTALQTGTVDGYDQSALYLFAASWHTASAFYSVTNHIYQPAAIVYNKAAWDSYPQEIRTALIDAGLAVEGDLRKQVRAMTPILLQNAQDLGVQVNVLTPAELAPFRKLGAQARAEYVKSAPKKEQILYEKMTRGLADFRAGKAK